MEYCKRRDQFEFVRKALVGGFVFGGLSWLMLIIETSYLTQQTILDVILK